MSRIICSTSTQSLGCTFIDWSINYLAGHVKFLSKQHGWIDLVENPIAGNNAHQHRKNHPGGYKETRECVEFFGNQHSYFSLYPCPARSGATAKILGIDVTNLTTESLQLVQKYQQHDYNLLLEYLDQTHAKIVFVKLDQPCPLYFLESRNNSLPFDDTTHAKSPADITAANDRLFFKHSTAAWQAQGLTNQWDYRERLALDTRPFESPAFDVVVPDSALSVDANQLWYHGNEEIVKIMNYCELAIDSARLNQWQVVYKQWQKIQLDALSFQLNYQSIINAVIQGIPMEIDLSFAQEVVIQHCLIYQHNLNLKTWQLDKFPNNTQDLHKLLESNIHPVSKIY